MNKEQEVPLIVTRNELARFTEYLNEDAPTVVRDIHAGVAILLHLDTRRVVGYRVYDINEGWRRSSDEQAEVVACPDCGGNGHIAVDVSHPECCGQFGKSGECCGDAVEGRHQEAMPCQRCLGLGWFTASPPAVAAGGVTGLLAEIDDILDEDAPNKWVWKTHASLGEWCRDKLLPVIRKTRAALAVRDEGIREGWQPIETAPKDGTEVLLWGVCWRDHQAYAPDRNVGWWAGDHLGWQTRGQDEDIDPTHWRPIPTPPSRGEGV